MSRTLLISGLVLAALWASGCIVVDSKEEWPHKPRPEPPQGPVVVEPEDVTIREIDAVGKLAFTNDRQAAYKQIAQRPDLAQGAQLYLVDAIFKRMAFENAKVDLLLTLIRNPAFTVAAQMDILDRLDSLAFENNKRTILSAINQRRGRPK